MAHLPLDISAICAKSQTISTVKMRTGDTPFHIIYYGIPALQGTTLLEKLEDARKSHDNIREKLLSETDSAALLVYETELTATGEADIGVLFMTSEGWQAMNPHVTIGLGRFILDAARGLLPGCEFPLDLEKMTVVVKLHCPCGVIEVTVPVTEVKGEFRCDTKRAVSFRSVRPSIATFYQVRFLPTEWGWQELGDRALARTIVHFNGTFYAQVRGCDLGFPYDENEKDASMKALSSAMEKFRLILEDGSYMKHQSFPAEERGLKCGLGIVVTSDEDDTFLRNIDYTKTGVCFFGNRRTVSSGQKSSPTSEIPNGVKKEAIGVSSVSQDHGFEIPLKASVIFHTDRLDGKRRDIWNIDIEGRPLYTGFSTIVDEMQDHL